MMNFSPELIARAKEVKSAEELIALAKDNNVELTEEQAKTYFEQLNATGAISDDELDAVAGGGCGDTEEERRLYPDNAVVETTDGSACSKCESKRGYITYRLGTGHYAFRCVKCVSCDTVMHYYFDKNRIVLC